MRRTLAIPALIASLAIAPASAQLLPSFEKQQLSDKYYAEGINTGDLNRDGMPDVVCGPFWWEGPDFRRQHKIYPPRAFAIGGYADNFFSFIVDVNQDGWPDVVMIGFPGTAAVWFENPRVFNSTTPSWNRHLIHGTVGAESPTVQDLVVGGMPELICTSGGRLGYLTPDALGATRPWKFIPITGLGWPVFLHGLGVGDVNGDGRPDVLTVFGWLEQPGSLSGNPLWKAHPFSFSMGTGGAQMFAYDVDGDGDRDVITSLNAHGWGLSWFEHVVVNNQITFQEHVILPPTKQPTGTVQFSQLHAVDLVDVDGDGLQDIVTGKAFWAHNGSDPGATDPRVLYWFRLTRTNGKVTFAPQLVDSNSGIGRQVVARDVNADGRPDILAGNKSGIFVFRQRQLTADVDQLSLKQAGVQTLSLDAGKPNASGLYWMFGSATGTAPGVALSGRHVPLSPDLYTDFALSFVNTTLLTNFKGRLDQAGRATARFQVPSGLPPLVGVTLHHAFVVYDGTGAVYSVSNPVKLRLF